jgi:thiol-disulfide isomerase/thioredoxin
MKKLRLPLVLGALAVAALCIPQGNSVESLTGKRMPAFKMMDTKGNTHSNASLRGKVVLLDFWASWCGPCKAASPTMQALHKKYASRGLVVIGANAEGTGDGMAIAKKYATVNSYTYPFTAGNEDFARKIGVSGLPTFVIVDKQGVVRLVAVGFDTRSTPREFEDAIKRLL